MGLSVFAARQESGEVYAAATTMADRVEIQQWLEEGGAADRVIAFLALPERDTMTALAGLIQMNDFGGDLDQLLTDVFKLGMEIQNNER